MNRTLLTHIARLGMLIFSITMNITPVFAVQVVRNKLSVSTDFTPNPPSTQGTETMTITVRNAAGKLVHGATVKIATSMPTMSMSGGSAVAREARPGIYIAKMKLGYATRWAFDISVDMNGQHGSAHIEKELK